MRSPICIQPALQKSASSAHSFCIQCALLKSASIAEGLEGFKLSGFRVFQGLEFSGCGVFRV